MVILLPSAWVFPVSHHSEVYLGSVHSVPEEIFSFPLHFHFFGHGLVVCEAGSAGNREVLSIAFSEVRFLIH